MAMYAVMSGNTVSNVIMADDKEATEDALSCKLIEYTDENPASIGCIYDEAAGRFVAPAAVQILDPDSNSKGINTSI